MNRSRLLFTQIQMLLPSKHHHNWKEIIDIVSKTINGKSRRKVLSSPETCLLSSLCFPCLKYCRGSYYKFFGGFIFSGMEICFPPQSWAAPLFVYLTQRPSSLCFPQHTPLFPKASARNILGLLHKECSEVQGTPIFEESYFRILLERASRGFFHSSALLRKKLSMSGRTKRVCMCVPR